MKVIIKHLFIALVCFVTVYNCSSNDDTNNPEPVEFNISYSPDTYETPFYSEQQTLLPNITSNIGDPDSFALAEATSSISINAISGQLLWSPGLALGETTVTVQAIKDDQIAETEVTFINNFSGTFSGGLNDTDEDDSVEGDYDVVFNPDGTLIFTLDELDFNSNYNLNADNELTFNIQDNDTQLSFRGELEYSNNQIPFISGDWYLGPISAENRAGYFEFEWVPIGVVAD